MQYFKDQSGEVFGVGPGQDGIIQDTWLELTPQEIEVLLNPPMTAEQAVAHFERVTDQYLQSKIDSYNRQNGLAFTNIDAFPKYAINANSPHQAIANQFIVYAGNLWEAVRAYQATLTSIPTEAEFQAVLDGVVF